MITDYIATMFHIAAFAILMQIYFREYRRQRYEELRHALFQIRNTKLTIPWLKANLDFSNKEYLNARTFINFLIFWADKISLFKIIGLIWLLPKSSRESESTAVQTQEIKNIIDDVNSSSLTVVLKHIAPVGAIGFSLFITAIFTLSKPKNTKNSVVSSLQKASHTRLNKNLYSNHCIA